ncbi:hypothetical protein CMV30_12165 [Nibricoccus aquaticus]|uniref:Uncharacterized protein n=1 Tax=Nibricoccus aquaticus TaxID=2576891 RepID=A0A290QJZ3_9BACT|nr:hypothetical protein [Nibricoccus aquaticus]ATC64651.1 hypothetical protein CMV30_12165 [Nibricoccus aquaticus]
MNATPLPAARSSRPRLALVALTLAALASATLARADRFIVPTDSSSSSSPSPAPSSPSSGSSGSSSSGGGSYSGGSSSSGNYDSGGGGRFITPIPGGSYSSPGGNSGGGGFTGGGSGGYYGGHRGGYYYDPFWGGCYYWGGNYYYWGGHFYSSFHNRYSIYRDPSYYDYRSVPSANTQSPIFFPPSPPPLGAPVPPRPPAQTSITAPKDLASYLYEPFYAPLSTRITQADLTKKLLQRLDAFRTTRSRLQTELLARLDELKDVDPATRTSELNLLASRQAGDLSRLEAEADDLRGDLLHGGLVGLFSGSGDWNERRRWRLGEGTLALPREQLVSIEFRVIRAAAFYQEGLSPQQRRLLREVEMELQVAAFKPKDAAPANPDETLLFFSPETSRLVLPPDLPPDLSLKIETYEKDKSALKSELRDAIYTLDRVHASKRADALRTLASEQSPRFDTLEALADEIRAGFALLPNPPGPPTPPAFPAALSTRITAYQTEKTALQKILQASLDEVRKANGVDSFKLVKKDAPSVGPATFRFEVPKSENSDAVIAAARKAIETFNRDHEKRLADLGKEREAIRVEVARFATDSKAASGKSVETLLADFYAHLQQGERWQHYRYYQIATLQQGLSPQQRRLLFEVALERLNLSLPAGEYPP